MNKNIVLVGCGLMGKYHLMSLLNLDNGITIQIVEKSKEAIISAKKMDALRNIDPQQKIYFVNDVSDCDKNSDLTIIATQAKSRTNIIEELLRNQHKRFLIEKIVCQSGGEYKRLLKLFADCNAKGWVNTIRRYNDFYCTVPKYIKGGPISLNVVCNDFGLGSNAIHYLDILQLCGDYSDLKLNGNYLSEKLLPNRRGNGLVEFSGTIVGRTDQGNHITITFKPFRNMTANVSIISDNAKIFIDEISGNAFISTEDTGWQWKISVYKEPRVSEITSLITKDIFERDDCLLPSLKDSYIPHIELFKIFNKHLKLITGKLPAKCPIT